MTNIKQNRTGTICFVFGVFFLWTIAARAVALPPDPDNAALLYYQAYINRYDPDDLYDTQVEINKILKRLGSEPNEEIRVFSKFNRKTIELIEDASKIPQCDWGGRYSRGLTPNFRGMQFQLAYILAGDAAVLAYDGDYRKALNRSLTIRRLARHTYDGSITTYLNSLTVDKKGLMAIQYVLESMPPDADILEWLKNQLETEPDASQSLDRIIKSAFEIMLQNIRANNISKLRSVVTEKAGDKKVKKEIMSLTDEALLARVREPYEKFLQSVTVIIRSDMLYKEKYSEIQRLSDGFEEQANSNPFIIDELIFDANNIKVFYNVETQTIAQLNAVKVAVEIYLIKAETGQLPQTLPDGLPKDPYSSKDFMYEITKDGFVIRCWEKDIYQTSQMAESIKLSPKVNLPKEVIHMFEFKVKK